VTLLLSDADVRTVLDPAELVDPIEALYRPDSTAGQLTPARLNLHHDKAYLRLMPAILPHENLMGFKVFHRGIEGGVQYVVVVYDLTQGEIIGMVDSNYLTAARTGANSAVAARYLAPKALTVGIIGSGLEAETNLEAIARVASIKSAKVFSPRAERRELFAATMAPKLGFEVSAVDDPGEAVGDVDIALVATNTGNLGPIAYQAEWARDGQCIISVGSTSLTLRELDADTFARAELIVVDAAAEQVSEESADVVEFVADPANREYWNSHVAQLAELVNGGRTAPAAGQISLFKSVGTAGQDLVAARIACTAASAAGLGRDVGHITVQKFFHAR
jgi:alanine dehydrogenase